MFPARKKVQPKEASGKRESPEKVARLRSIKLGLVAYPGETAPREKKPPSPVS